MTDDAGRGRPKSERCGNDPRTNGQMRLKKKDTRLSVKAPALRAHDEAQVVDDAHAAPLTVHHKPGFGGG
jgi:hypothetical protein